MRRYSANYIFSVAQPPIKNGIVEVDEHGVIVNIINPGESFKEIHSTEFYNGVIVPGFVNAHCHLELSHLFGKIPKGLGIAGFIKYVSEQRLVSQSDIDKSIEKAIFELERLGTVAVGDICNVTDTLKFKSKSSIFFHNFIEVFGVNLNTVSATINRVVKVQDDFKAVYPHSTSITPHSTYALSSALWSKVEELLREQDAPVSIHFAESLPEYEFLRNGTGPILDRYKLFGVPFESPFELSPTSVVQDHICKYKNVLLIHNTFASIEELIELKNHFSKTTFVTCPESNLYIEGKLPDLSSMFESRLRIALGTDSLASATTLSMLYHINLILENFPNIPFAEVLKWATLNGAEALSVSEKYGSIEQGKSPGLNLITNFDFANMQPSRNSSVRRLV
ncbi:MAG: amidohydrolase family protein [Bacteroidales bacterium]